MWKLTNTSTPAASQDIFRSSLGISWESGVIKQWWVRD
jgi:hypothetical protein